MKAGLGIILAGGKSARYSGAAGVPKALAEIGGTPMIGVVAASLARGAAKIIVLTGDNHEAIAAAFGLPPSARTFGALGVTWRDGTSTEHEFELRRTPPDCGTAGRLAHVDPDETGDAALLSYTDILSDIPTEDLLRRLETTGAAAVIAAVNPRAPWGEVDLSGEFATNLREKPLLTDTWINAGVFALSPGFFDEIGEPSQMLETAVLPGLAARGRVAALRHRGYWRAVDTVKDHSAVIADAEDPLAWAPFTGVRIVA